MIVKNEAHVIEGTLQNLYEKIRLDYWVIVDTGSTDNTKEIITQFFKNKNIPGEIYSTEWQDFAFNRTDALNRAYNKTDYVLIFDADDKILGNLVLPELTADKYLLTFGKEFTYTRPLLVNNRIKSKFVGVLHEYFTFIDNDNIASTTIHGDYYLESGRTGARSMDPEKYYKDALVLEKAHNMLDENKNDDDLKIRYAFYCAQSYKDCNKKDKAIEWYNKRIEYGGWNQEVYFSYITLGHLYMNMGEKEKAMYNWIMSIDVDNERLEGLYEIVKYYRNIGKYNLAYKYYMMQSKTVDINSKLFVSNTIYDYEMDMEFTILAAYVNKHKDAIPVFMKLFSCKSLNVSNMSLLLNNFRFYYKYVDTNSEHYNTFSDFIYEYYKNNNNVSTEQMLLIDEILNRFKENFKENFKETLSFPIKIINLKNKGKQLLDKINITNCELIEINNSELNDNMIKLFKDTTTICHIKLWSQLLIDKTSDCYCIMEDDISFSPEEIMKINKSDNDILFLGFNTDKKIEEQEKRIVKLNPDDYNGGLFAYIITKNGAMKLLQKIVAEAQSSSPRLNVAEAQSSSPRLNVAEAQSSSTRLNKIETIIKSLSTLNMSCYEPHLVLRDEMWDFYQGFDSKDFDIEYVGNMTLDKLKSIAKQNPDCVGFNTLGFMKSKITFPLVSSIYFKKHDGIYVKKNYINTNNKEINKYEQIYNEFKVLKNKKLMKEAYHIINNVITNVINNDDINNDKYKEIFDYEKSIVHFYAFPDNMKGGMKQSLYYLNNYGNNTNNVYDNIDYYLERLASIGNIKPLNFHVNDMFNTSSCSIAEFDGKIIINARSVNYRIIEGKYITYDNVNNTFHEWAKVYTNNSVITTDDSFNFDPNNVKLFDNMIKDLPIQDSRIKGLEDVRIFTFQNELYYTATSCEFSTKGKYNIVLGKYDINALQYTQNKIILSPYNSECEKNWIPINHNDQKMLFIYKWHPLEIGELDNNTININIRHNTPVFFKHYRGSTGLCEYNNMLWCITHTAKYYTPRKYFHQFVVLEKDTYKPIKYSIPFYFNYYQIEYTLGFIIKNNKANIIFSQNDSQPCLLQVDMNKLSDMMIDI